MNSLSSNHANTNFIELECRWITRCQTIDGDILNEQVDFSKRLSNQSMNHSTLFKSYLNLLNCSDSEKIVKYYFLADAYRALIGRLLIYKLLNLWTGKQYNKIHLFNNKYGKPFYKIHHDGTENQNPHVFLTDFQCNSSFQLELSSLKFNISHHGDYVGLVGYVKLLIVEKQQVIISPPSVSNVSSSESILYGCDLATIDIPDPNNAKFDNHNQCGLCDLYTYFSTCFNPSEWNIMNRASISSKSRYEEFYRFWAHKEALIKAIGMGLSYDLLNIQFKHKLSHPEAVNQHQIYSSSSSDCVHQQLEFHYQSQPHSSNESEDKKYSKNPESLLSVDFLDCKPILLLGDEEEKKTDQTVFNPKEFDWEFDYYRIDIKHLFVVAKALKKQHTTQQPLVNPPQFLPEILFSTSFYPILQKYGFHRVRANNPNIPYTMLTAAELKPT